jgi:hypothetical protein
VWFIDMANGFYSLTPNLFCRDKSATYIRNLIQGFVALATAAKEGLPLTPLWTLSAPPEHHA